MNENGPPSENGLDYDPVDQHRSEEDSSPNKRGFLVKLVTLLVLMAFIASSVPQLSYLIGDRLDFLQQNQILRDDQIVQMCKPAVVSIEAVDASNPIKTSTHTGTGFNIDPSGIIITNEHIVAGATTITITFESGVKFFANRFESVPGFDLVVLRLGGSDLPAIDVDLDSLPKTSATVTIIGNPLGFQKIAQRGKVVGYYNRDGEGQPVMAIQLPINPGNSGSPVINQQAQVVGIIYGSTTIEMDGRKEPQALAIPARALADILE